MSTDRYTVISADGHAGASVADVPRVPRSRAGTTSSTRGRSRYRTRSRDLAGSNAYRNWDSDRRLAELEADGIVAEVLFPNTIPPFFPSGALVTPAPTGAEYEHRWAGLQAHNRWLADFCAAAPGRRAGIAQILLNDVDDAIAEVRFGAAAGLFGGVLLPGVPPNHEIPPLWSDVLRAAVGARARSSASSVNHHSGGGLPDVRRTPTRGARRDAGRDPDLRAPRAVAPDLRGVFERHPRPQVRADRAGHELGAAARWPTSTGSTERMRMPTAAEYHFGGEAVAKLPLTPSEYFRAQLLGRRQLHPRPSSRRCATTSASTASCGAATTRTPKARIPTAARRCARRSRDVPEPRSRAMLGDNAAEVYGFDLDVLDAIARACRPDGRRDRRTARRRSPPTRPATRSTPDAIVRTW